MDTNNRKLIWLVVVLGVILVALTITYAMVRARNDDARMDAEPEVRAIVETFGKKLMNVPLSAEKAVAAKAMTDNYAEFVSPALLREWANNPAKAPGRLVSSPWPDRIEIEEVIKGTDSYEVHGKVVEVTSAEVAGGGVAASYLVDIELRQNASGKWLISAFAKGDYESKPESEWVSVQLDGVSFERPADSKFELGEGLGGGRLAPSLAKISLPRNRFKDEKSNFSEAYMVIGRSSEKGLLSTCETFADLPNRAENDSIGTKTLNGLTWRTETAAEAAAGNLYESRLYRIAIDGACYEAALTLHTGNINNYPAESGIKEFDKEKAFSILERALATLRFTK